MLCKHEWKVIGEEITESKIEHARKLGLTITNGSGHELERKHIQIITCKKCGKLHRFVESI